MAAAETQKAIKALEQDYERQKEAFEKWKGSSILSNFNSWEIFKMARRF